MSSSLQFRPEFVKVQRLHALPWSALHPGQVLKDVGPERLRKSSVRLADVALEELDDGGWK